MISVEFFKLNEQSVVEGQCHHFILWFFFVAIDVSESFCGCYLFVYIKSNATARVLFVFFFLNDRTKKGFCSLSNFVLLFFSSPFLLFFFSFL